MRQRHTLKGKSTAELNMTPMIDIVFILLIFFLVNTSFVKETGIEVNRLTAQTSERQEHGNILLAISPTGEVWIQNRRVDVRAIRANIERLHAENPEGTVVIVADEGARTGVLVEAMDQVRLAGATNIAIAANEK